MLLVGKTNLTSTYEYTYVSGKSVGTQQAEFISMMVKLWELGYESFYIDRAVQITSKKMKNLLKSRQESMQSIVYMAEVIA